MEASRQENILKITFEEKIDYSITTFYPSLKQIVEEGNFDLLYLNFRRTTNITLPAAMYIICIVHDIVGTKGKVGHVIETHITEVSTVVATVLCNYGLIETLKFYGNLKISRELEEMNQKKRVFWKKNVFNREQLILNQVYWPISTIPPRYGTNYESEISKLFNEFNDYFFLLAKNDLLNNVNDNEIEYFLKHFTSAINESIKNIWDHSESFGIAAIVSNRSRKNTLCLFDYGIGFLNSYIKRKGSYVRSNTSDIEVIQWLLEEGNTSNDASNHGHGLKRIASFVQAIGGMMLIKTDKYQIYLDDKTDYKYRVTEKYYYPGTQIMINF